MDGGGRKHRSLGVGWSPAMLDSIRLPVPGAVRKPFRIATRHWRALLDGRLNAPKHATSAMNVSVLGASLAVAALCSGQIGAWADEALASAGLAVTDVRLDGVRETSDAAISDGIGTNTTRSLPAINVAASRAALLSLPWVESVEIEKVYPGTLSVRVREREAVALWRVGSRTLMLDPDGQPIVVADGRNLPLLVGEGADGAMRDGLELFNAVPNVTRHIKALVRVGDRRWNVVTHRNVVVMLPEQRPDEALERLVTLHATNSLLDQDLASIDLRVADRVALRLPEAGAEARRTRAEAAAKERSRTRKDREVSL